MPREIHFQLTILCCRRPNAVSEVVQILQLCADRDQSDVVGDLSVCLDGMTVDSEAFATAEADQHSEFPVCHKLDLKSLFDMFCFLIGLFVISTEINTVMGYTNKLNWIEFSALFEWKKNPKVANRTDSCFSFFFSLWTAAFCFILVLCFHLRCIKWEFPNQRGSGRKVRQLLPSSVESH